MRELAAKVGKSKKVFTPAPVNQALYDQISASAETSLKDAMNTQKYEKLESYSRVDACKKATIGALPEEQHSEAKAELGPERCASSFGPASLRQGPSLS